MLTWRRQEFALKILDFFKTEVEMSRTDNELDRFKVIIGEDVVAIGGIFRRLDKTFLDIVAQSITRYTCPFLNFFALHRDIFYKSLTWV